MSQNKDYRRLYPFPKGGKLNEITKSVACKCVVAAVLGLFVCVSTTMVCSAADQAGTSSADTDQNARLWEVCPVSGDQAVTRVLKPIRQEHRVPALAGLILAGGRVEACGVAGVRKIGTQIPATVNDKWHLGSCTKAMTATLVGMLVERGALRWNTTVGEVFPNLTPTFHSEAKGITVIQLLSHHAGLRRDLNWSDFSKEKTTREQRIQVVKRALSEKPQNKPGSEYQYSNLGYVVAGAIIEKVRGENGTGPILIDWIRRGFAYVYFIGPVPFLSSGEVFVNSQDRARAVEDCRGITPTPLAMRPIADYKCWGP